MNIKRYDTENNQPMRHVSFGKWVTYDDAYKNNEKAYLQGFIVGTLLALAGVVFGLIF